MYRGPRSWANACLAQLSRTLAYGENCPHSAVPASKSLDVCEQSCLLTCGAEVTQTSLVRRTSPGISYRSAQACAVSTISVIACTITALNADPARSQLSTGKHDLVSAWSSSTPSLPIPSNSTQSLAHTIRWEKPDFAAGNAIGRINPAPFLS